MKIGILGQGYVGHELAIAAIDNGHEVVGFDTNLELINSLKSKYSNLSHYHLTIDESDLELQEIYIIAVPTPLDSLNLPKLDHIISASKLIAQYARDGSLIINESTSYPGTLRNIVKGEIEKINSYKLFYSSAPERIDPGNKIWNIKNIPRIVAGIDDHATKLTLDFYNSICEEVSVVSAPEVAELSKLFENTFRQVNIALVNELAQISEKMGVSAFEVIAAASTKVFGYMKFYPSLGVGGHCIPIDPVYLTVFAEELGVEAELIKHANNSNRNMPLYIFQRLKKLMKGNLKGKKIILVGISYKADVRDTRLSPAIQLWKELEMAGANVFFHDDLVSEFENISSTALSPNSFDLAVVNVLHKDLNRRSQFTLIFDSGTYMQYELFF
jgi:UDP-N-acetyl-D-glucosamine dehydrogenase